VATVEVMLASRSDREGSALAAETRLCGDTHMHVAVHTAAICEFTMVAAGVVRRRADRGFASRVICCRAVLTCPAVVLHGWSRSSLHGARSVPSVS